MDKVYLVSHNIHYEGSSVMGVFSSLEKATAFVEKHLTTIDQEWAQIEKRNSYTWSGRGEDYTIDEVAVDLE